ncbi:MAG: GNAT family N-acetyltransferase, partial [Myxococcales bacterium]|nr:GNAT family N-acetyltransferase [Myxococcales bacterium]
GILEVDRACAESGDGMVLDVDQLELDLGAIDRRSRPSELQRVFVVAHPSGTIAGYASARKLFPARVRHVATLAVAVHPGWQRQGLGRALMREAVAWAERAGASRLELYVRSDNRRAISLYRSLGFEREAVRKGFIATLAGELIDDFIMVRFAQPLTSPIS